MNIKNLSKITSIAAIALALSVAAAKAGPLNGSLNFYATNPPTTDTGNLSTATEFTSITGTYVEGGATGSYAGLVGDAATFSTPISFTQAGSNLLWTITTTTGTYTFDETSIGVQSPRSTTFLNISGNGVAYFDGTDATYGTWSITDTSTGNSGFTFSASTTVVPDSGSTALLIGLGIAALAVGVVAQKRKSTVA